MCIAAVVNGSTVQYTLSGTGRRTPGWMGMGFGSTMANTPMVIMWGNSNGSITLSQRQAISEIQPSVVASPPRVATLSTALSTTSGNAAFVFTIPANSDTTQKLIFGFGTANPGDSSTGANLQQHLDYGSFALDLTAALTATSTGTSTAATSTSTSSSGDSSSGPTDDIPLTPYQRMIIAHAVFCVLVARYLRTFTPTWYTGHWIAQFGIGAPPFPHTDIQLIGVQRARRSSSASRFPPCLCLCLTPPQKNGVILFALYLTQCVVGAVIHWVKPKNAKGRPPQNYLHAIFGLAIIGFGMYQIRSGYREEWPNYTALGSVPSVVNTLWMCGLLPLLYAGGLTLLRKQYRQEDAYRKGYGVDDQYGGVRPRGRVRCHADVRAPCGGGARAFSSEQQGTGTTRLDMPDDHNASVPAHVKIALSLGPFGAGLSPAQEFDGFYPPPYGPSAYSEASLNRNAFAAGEEAQEAEATEALARFHFDRLWRVRGRRRHLGRAGFRGLRDGAPCARGYCDSDGGGETGKAPTKWEREMQAVVDQLRFPRWEIFRSRQQ
ncbi:hypothetical protein B0H10DRAFT_2036588 [Mycena sp. CBHHK59/15]|nr:hypothetical protein B0H10DRAFT_2036588 [Mycena sp. CBHHK59/15]